MASKTQRAPRRPRTSRAPRNKPAPPRTVALVSLGCPKNLVDSEKMLGLLAEDGLSPVPSDDPADVVIINTCGFLEASKDESLGEIRDAIARKQRGEVGRVVVAGCLVQRHRAKMLEWCPEIDALIGVFDRDRIVDAVRGKERGTRDQGRGASHPLPVYSSIATNATLAKQARQIDSPGYFESDAARLRLTPRHYAYLRISEGCNQNCAFCTIPSIRGKMRSKPVEAILAEARELFADGAFELNLIGQDTTSYGQDIGYSPGLVGMLEALNKTAEQHAPGSWLRLMYAYPSCFSDAMIDAIARLPRLVKYIDMPLQHIDDAVLDAMRRRTSRKLIETLLDKLRTRIPGMAIRTTFISGFPGETQAQHDALVRFVRDFGFDAMGVFPYSPEPGTPAGTLHGEGQAVPDAVIRERIDELMTTQQAVVFERNRAMADAGVECDVLIDAPSSRAAESSRPAGRPRKPAAPRHVATGRTASQAPQIDAVTCVQSHELFAPGEVVRCRITTSDGYDLIAQPVVELEKNVSLAVVS